jgi:hypothetical protein
VTGNEAKPEYAAVTNAEGRFKFDDVKPGHFILHGLNPGEYQVFALDADVDRDETADPEFVRTHESLGKTIKLEEGEHKNIVLKLAVSSD